MSDEPFIQLLQLIEELGWDLALPDIDDDDDVPGLIIGTPEYIEWVLAGSEGSCPKVTSDP